MPVAVWAMLIALAPLLLRVIDTFLHFPVGSGAPIGLHDPDSWLRLTLVRDWLTGGGWYDHHYLSNAPFDAMQSPWTRPLDLVIAFFTKLQFTDTALTTKLLRTATILPLLWFALQVGALLTITRRITAMPHALLLVGVLLVTAPINYNYLAPGNVDHHAPLAAIFCWVVALLLNHDQRRGNGLTAIGILLALMLWISPEAMLIIAIVYGWLGLQWLAGASLKPLVKISTVTTFAAALAIAVESPPAQWLVTYYDSISISQLTALALVALAARLLSRITSFFWIWRGFAALVLTLAIIMLLHTLDPKFFMGPAAQGTDYIRTDFLPHIQEAMHGWSQHWLKLIGLLIPAVAAIYIALRCATQRNGIIAPAQAAALLYLLLTTLALYLLQLRWAYYFFPLVPVVLAPYLASWLNPQHRKVDSFWPALKLRRLNDRQLMLRRIPLLLWLLAVPGACIIGSALMTEPERNDKVTCASDVRRLIQHGEIDAIGKGKQLNIFAATDAGSEILFFTKHRIIAGNYHREGPGIEAVWSAQLDTDLSTFRDTLRKRKVDLAILCYDNNAPEDAGLHRLIDGETPVPAYLTRYRIKTKGLSKTPPAIFLVKDVGR